MTAQRGGHGGDGDRDRGVGSPSGAAVAYGPTMRAGHWRAAGAARALPRLPLTCLPLTCLALACLALACLALAVPAGTAAPPLAAPTTRAPAPDRAGDPTITVMTRNLYLGADVGVALDLLPDMPAAAQTMWEQVARTDAAERMALLAQEAAAVRPEAIALQEATTWSCRPAPWRSPVTVLDFTQLFLAATEAAGVGYVVAGSADAAALNPGYEIPPIPWLTTVTDPATFQPLFGRDSAACGFTIADAVLVRADLRDQVLRVGTGEYEDRYAVVPVAFQIDRGYAWADLAVAGTTVRLVATHLESLWAPEGEVTAAAQARQLVADLATTTLPLVVMGDLNSDPRDPRPPGSPNPGDQPESGMACPPQVPAPTPATADPTCSAYWTLVQAGYQDAGPDSQAAANRTWGAAADLAGPDPDRLQVALEQGNPAGFTDRLDYVLTRNAAHATRAELVGNRWPQGLTWSCDAPQQVATTQRSSQLLADAGLADPVTGRGVCLPSDHAGLAVVVDVSAGPTGAVADSPVPPEHDAARLGLLGWLVMALGAALAVLVLVLALVVVLLGRARRRRSARAPAPDQPSSP